MDGLAGAGSPENKELAVATMSEKVAISDFDLSSKWVYVTLHCVRRRQGI